MENTAPQQVRFGEWISEGWGMFTAQWKGWVVLALGLFGAVMVPMTIFIIFVFVTLSATAAASSDASGVGIFLIFACFFLLMLVMLPLSALLTGGMYKAAFKQLRGGQVEFKDLFSARDRYVPLLGGMLLHGVLVALGGLLCVIPGFIVAGLLFFTIPLIIDRNLGVIEAMKASAEMTKPNLLMFTLFALVVQLIAGAGEIACVVGLLATLPLMFTMSVAAYRNCFGLEGAALLPAPEPWSGASYSPPALGANQPFSAPPPQPQQMQPPATFACPNCEASLPASAKFCFRCGAPAPGQ
jgi:zinc-ribbon domain